MLEAAPKGEGNPLSLCRWELQETPELPHPAPAPTALLGLSCCCTNPLPSCPSYPRADISGEDLNSSNSVKISPKPLFQHGSRNKNTTPVQAASSAALTLQCPNPPQASCAAANGCDQVQLFYRDQIQLALPVHHSLQLCLLWMNLPSISTALQSNGTVLSHILGKGMLLSGLWALYLALMECWYQTATGKQRAPTARLKHDCSWSTRYSQQQLLFKCRD